MYACLSVRAMAPLFPVGVPANLCTHAQSYFFRIDKLHSIGFSTLVVWSICDLFFLLETGYVCMYVCFSTHALSCALVDACTYILFCMHLCTCVVCMPVLVYALGICKCVSVSP